MTEVKEFDRHLRFRKYLAREDALGQLPIRTKNKAPTIQKSIESEYEQGDVSQPAQEADPKVSSVANIKESSSPLAYPPRRPRKSGGDSAESGSRGMPDSSQSGTPTSMSMPHPTGWGNLPMTLPPPFSRDTRSVSDAQSLPSAQYAMKSQPLRTDTGPRPPETPPRRSSLRGGRTDIRSNSPTLGGSRRRLVSSAVRFVESIVRSPSRSSQSPSPSPSLHIAGSDSSSPGRAALESLSRAEFGFRIYNDALPASSQPQTPHNLPEARHRSRLHGSYTAPLPRHISRSLYQSSTERGRRDTTSSPSGFDTPGFQGLYSGRENTEDSMLFHEASRFREESSGGRE